MRNLFLIGIIVITIFFPIYSDDGDYIFFDPGAVVYIEPRTIGTPSIEE